MKKTKQYRGIVEGFFSYPRKPWSDEERLILLKYINKFAPEINAYFYCPKDDKYTNKNWDRKFSVSYKKSLVEFKSGCEEKGVDYIYGFNPYFDKNTDLAKLKNDILKKIKELERIGLDKICLLFDDIPIAYDVLDSVDSVFSSNNKLVEFVDLINDIYTEPKIELSDFWICAPDYTFARESSITQALRNLNPEIGIIWTGNSIYDRNISSIDIERIKRLLFKEVRLIYWMNYPVNDCEQNVGVYNLGPFPKVNANITKSFSGVFVNPMRESYSNLPFFKTYSDYWKNPKKYNENYSWEKAIGTIFESCDSTSINDLFYNFSIQSKISNSPRLFEKDIGRNSPKVFSEYLSKLNSSTKSARPNKYGKLFIQSTDSVYKEFTLFQKITKQILSAMNVDLKLFKRFDVFPTNPNLARFADEIILIITQKAYVYQNYSENKKMENRMQKALNMFVSKYKGENRLKINASDEKLLLREVSMFIKMEQSNFLEILNNASIPTKSRLLMLARRRNKNRFTLSK